MIRFGLRPGPLILCGNGIFFYPSAEIERGDASCLSRPESSGAAWTAACRPSMRSATTPRPWGGMQPHEISRSVRTSHPIYAIDAASTRLLHAIDTTLYHACPRSACPKLNAASPFEVGLKRPSAAHCDAIDATRRLGTARQRSSSAPGREAVVSWRARRA